MYFEQECIKKDVGVSVATGLELNEATCEEWNFTYFVFSLPDILFQLWSGPAVLFCFLWFLEYLPPAKYRVALTMWMSKLFTTIENVIIYLSINLFILQCVLWKYLHLFVTKCRREADKKPLSGYLDRTKRFLEKNIEKLFCFFNTLKFDGANILCHYVCVCSCWNFTQLVHVYKHRHTHNGTFMI